MERFDDIDCENVFAEDDLFVVAHDPYPVSPSYSHIIVKGGVARFHELNVVARSAICRDYSMTSLTALLTQRDSFPIS